ncbi:MAG: glycosyltransferase family 2 protein [Candidatus Omnitrophica bacterium]|nr:glycosyltransferase family 2 protein [Candidatus Omnitrophota bacterium]
MTLVSIIVPCYNEQDNIVSTHNALSDLMKSLKYDFEIIFVDNGGTDNQLELMKELHVKDTEHVKVISLSRNFGYQMSMSAGLEYAKGDAVIIIDADLQDPPSVIKQFLNKWEEGYDVVYGIREKRKGPLLLRALYKLFYILLKITADIPIPLNSGEFSLMSRRVVNEITAMPEKIRFVRGLRAWAGFKQIGIPYTRLMRKAGKTKFNFFTTFTLALDGILSFSTRILSLLTIIGFVTSIMSILLLLFILYLKFFSDQDIPGYTAIMVTISFFSGIIVAMLGIIGAYIERVFLEVKGRPKFIVKETFGIAR